MGVDGGGVAGSDDPVGTTHDVEGTSVVPDVGEVLAVEVSVVGVAGEAVGPVEVPVGEPAVEAVVVEASHTVESTVPPSTVTGGWICGGGGGAGGPGTEGMPTPTGGVGTGTGVGVGAGEPPGSFWSASATVLSTVCTVLSTTLPPGVDGVADGSPSGVETDAGAGVEAAMEASSGAAPGRAGRLTARLLANRWGAPWNTAQAAPLTPTALARMAAPTLA